MSGRKLGRNPFEKRAAKAAPEPEQSRAKAGTSNEPNRSRVLHAEARSAGPTQPGAEIPGKPPGAGELAEWTIAFSAGVCFLGLRAALVAYDLLFPDKRRA